MSTAPSVPHAPAAREPMRKIAYVKGVFVFLANYIILLLLVCLFVWLNSLRTGGQGFSAYVRENYTTLIYLMASVFMLCVIVFFYYFFEDKRVLGTPKRIWLIFILLETSVLVCYFFSYFFNIYSRPIAMMAMLSLMLIGRRDAIFLNVIFALLLFSVDRFSNFSMYNDYENALNSTPLLVFSSASSS